MQMDGEAEIVEGEVCRFSGSGNAMLRTDDEVEYNLGPLPRGIENERVRAYRFTDIWAVCIESEYVTGEYVQEMQSRIPVPVSIERLESVENRPATEDDTNRIVWTEFTSSGRYSEYEGRPISVSLTGFLEDISVTEPLPVRILTVRRGVACGVPALETLEADEVAPGDDITMTVQRTVDQGEGVVGCTDDLGVPIAVTDIIAKRGKTVQAGVTDVFNTHITSSPIALSDEAWPELDETVNVDVQRVTSEGRAWGLCDGLPAVILEGRSCIQHMDAFKAAVVGLTDGRLRLSVDSLDSDERPVIGDATQCEVVHREPDGTLCRSEGVPVWIPGSVPGPVEYLSVVVIQETPSHLVGSVAQMPEIESLADGGTITALISYEDGDEGVGLYEDVPISVPGGNVLVGNRVKLAAAEVQEGKVVAGVNGLDELPEVGEEVVLSEEQYSSRNGRICILDSVPIVLPAGSDWPVGEIRLGVDEVLASGVCLSVDALPTEERPDVGDELELEPGALTFEGDKTLIDGVPVQLPSYPWKLGGSVRLGVSGLQPNCVRCSVRGLPSTPSVGEQTEVIVDGNVEGGCGGRIEGVPAFLPRADIPHGEVREVLVTDITDSYIVAVEVDTTPYLLDIGSDSVVAYYTALLDAREAWHSNGFESAREHCQTAERAIDGERNKSLLMQLDAKRQSFLLMGESIRKVEGTARASSEVRTSLESFDLPDIPAAEFVIDELKAYRFILAGIREDGSMTAGYLNATVRTLNQAKGREDDPWSEVVPHPIIATLLASIEMPNVPAADQIHRFVSRSPEYWPFLTLSELS